MRGNVRLLPILLKKSVFASEENFLKALVRSRENLVGGGT
jgi:hypothetical protein